MKHPLNRGLLLLALLLGMAFQMFAQSTHVHVTIFLNDGTETSYDMSSASYMYYEDGVKLVITEGTDGMTTVSYPLADIRKITCEEQLGTPENSIEKAQIYPNPTHDMLTISNIDGKRQMKIYALDGRLVKSMQVINNQTLDISDLTAGLYLVDIESVTLKLMKL